MKPEVMWQLFCLTGEPLAYLFYRSAGGKNDNDVF